MLRLMRLAGEQQLHRKWLATTLRGVGGGTRNKTPREVGTTDLWLSAA
jgi:hypothetical protein